MGVTAVILAAGQGTRMKSKHPKVVHEILGRPMVLWVVEAAREAGADRIVVVIGNGADEVRELLRPQTDVECVLQEERLGTGHATRVALQEAGIDSGQVLVLCGDTPLLQGDTLRGLVARAQEPLAPAPGDPTPAAPAAKTLGGALLTMEYADPTGYGRVMVDSDGLAQCIVEHKDCTPEQRACTTCNAGVYCFDAALLRAHIGELDRNNAQNEYYLTDMVRILRAADAPLAQVACPGDGSELMGVNSRAQLAQANAAMQRRINARHMAAGVTMLDPAQVWIGPDVTIGRDTVILPGTMLWGKTSVGEDCVLGPQTRLTDTTVGDGCTVDETVAVRAVLHNQVTCGPRAYLRPGTVLMDRSKAGTHVEIKGSTVGEGSKVPHLTYLGDTTVGSGVNIGAGTITCNYDGKFKHPTSIGDDVFVGSGTMIVAPVALGDRSWVGAGSVLTQDVPADSLALGRARQTVKVGWKPGWAREEEAE